MTAHETLRRYLTDVSGYALPAPVTLWARLAASWRDVLATGIFDFSGGL